ncbi:MAG: molybdopterin-guanine dinucleotide biosynthesis protein B [Candidatus Cloacimonetes bacterium]|nr:molybdopterin-guanine dinucleotide biosynthesis protein B [Candidatus Cloacimonadota bacterium]
MKVLSIAGYHHTGKTTVVVELLRELNRRGYSTATIKDIHAENFSMDKPGSNTWKHWEAGGKTVFARGREETYQIWHRRLELTEMLAHLSTDFVLVEGMKSAALPRLICAGNEEQLAELVDETVFGVSGIYADTHTNYHDLPVISARNEINLLADLVESKVFPVLPLAKPECCSACGMSCREMTGAILSGKRSRQDCRISGKTGLTVSVDGRLLTLVPFVNRLLRQVIRALLGNLEGGKGSRIEIIIDE